MTYLLVGIASLGGVLFGYQTGVAAGALHLASNAWTLDGRYLVLLSTGTLIGALVGALSSGKLADLIGRRDVIMATAALFTLGAFVSAIAPSVHVLLLGRLIVGAAVGAMSVAAPLYIAEIAPPAKRGVLVCFFQLAITAGILLAYLGNEIFSSWPNGWRYVLGMGAIPGILLSGLALLLLESPLWLALQGDEDEALVHAGEAKTKPLRFRVEADYGGRSCSETRSVPRCVRFGWPKSIISLRCHFLLPAIRWNQYGPLLCALEPDKLYRFFPGQHACVCGC